MRVCMSLTTADVVGVSVRVSKGYRRGIDNKSNELKRNVLPIYIDIFIHICLYVSVCV